MLRRLILIPLLVLGLLQAAPRARAEDLPRLPEQERSGGFFGDLEERINFVIGDLHQIIGSEKILDKAVGDPHALRPETLANLAYIPDRMKLNLARLIANNSANIIALGEQEPLFQPSNWQNPAALNSAGESWSFEIPEELAKEFPQAAYKGAFDGALPGDQILDLVFYLMSKAGWIPRDAIGWEKFKKKVVDYDIYLAALFLAASTAVGQGQLAISGWIFKDGNDNYRVGWYTKVKKLGMKLQPETEFGFKLRTMDFEVGGGLRKTFKDSERTELVANFAENWFSRVVRIAGWNVRSGLSANYVLADNDPKAVNTGTVNASVTATRDNYGANSKYLSVFTSTLTMSGSVGMDLHGKPTGSITAVGGNLKNSWLTTLNMSAGTELVADQTTRRDWRLQAFLNWKYDGGMKKVVRHIRQDADAIREDLEEVRRTKDHLNSLMREAIRGVTVTEEQQRLAEAWLGLARVRLFHHLTSYTHEVDYYERMRESSDPALAFLDPATLAEAQKESLGDTFGQENNKIYLR